MLKSALRSQNMCVSALLVTKTNAAVLSWEPNAFSDFAAFRVNSNISPLVSYLISSGGPHVAAMSLRPLN